VVACARSTSWYTCNTNSWACRCPCMRTPIRYYCHHTCHKPPANIINASKTKRLWDNWQNPASLQGMQRPRHDVRNCPVLRPLMGGIRKAETEVVRIKGRRRDKGGEGGRSKSAGWEVQPPMWSYVCFLKLLHRTWWIKPMMFGVQTQGFGH
jgi:hypothetical protein